MAKNRLRDSLKSHAPRTAFSAIIPDLVSDSGPAGGEDQVDEAAVQSEIDVAERSVESDLGQGGTEGSSDGLGEITSTSDNNNNIDIDDGNKSDVGVGVFSGVAQKGGEQGERASVAKQVERVSVQLNKNNIDSNIEIDSNYGINIKNINEGVNGMDGDSGASDKPSPEQEALISPQDDAEENKKRVAQEYMEAYLIQQAQKRMSFKNGKLVKVNKTDTQTPSMVYFDTELLSRTKKAGIKRGSQSDFVNVAVSFFLDQLGY